MDLEHFKVSGGLVFFDHPLVGGGSVINGFINVPVVSNADNILSRSLDRKFGSRKKWNVKSGNTKYFTSAVVDKKKLESSRV